MKASEDGGRDRSGPRRDVAVVGGGLAGLTAAAFLARAGLDVVVFETKSEVGGRARTAREKGFALNEGPHALYRSGAMARTARDLGIELSGGPGPTWATWAVQGERLFRLPVSVPGLMLTNGLDWREKLEFGRLLARLGRLDPDDHAGVPVGRWIDRRLDAPTNRALLRGLVRLSSYCPEDDLDAAAALSALQKGNRGVLYLDGGWQTLVDGLRSRARDAGALIETGTRIAAVERERGVLRVKSKAGDRMEADHAVLAVRPREAARLADPTPPSLEEAARSARPVRVATLDLGLERRPIPNRALALGVDAPHYLSDHAGAADLAPGNGALIHAVRYLGGRTPHPEEDRARIEAFLDRVHPGWRERVETRRFLPGAVVAHDTPVARTGGLDGRYGPCVEETDRLFVAGDWVGLDEMLSDAAAASCRQHVSRARHRLDDGRVRYEASRAEAEELRRAFAEATLDGDVERLVSLLADDAVHVSDGAGEVPAAREPVRGAENVARLLVGVVEGADEEVRVEPVDVNGTPGLMARVGDRLASVVSFAVKDGEIARVYQVLSPTKLRKAVGRRWDSPGPE